MAGIFESDKDFESFSLQAYLVNFTSRTEFLDSSKVEIGELAERQIRLNVLRTTCTQGHRLGVFFVLKKFPSVAPSVHALEGLAINDCIPVICKVKNIEVHSGSVTQSVELEITQVHEISWQSLLKKLEAFQCNINDALLKMRVGT